MNTNAQNHNASPEQEAQSNDPQQDKSSDSAAPSGDVGQLQAKVAELEKQLQEEKGRYVYLYADFENFKKRSIKERSDLLKFGWESPARELLEVVDNLERALEHVPEGTQPTLVEGLKMVLNQFQSTLEKQGIKRIQAKHTAFDPNLHEAVGQEASEHPEGTVVQEHVPGYTLHGRLLRPSRVVISNGKK